MLLRDRPIFEDPIYKECTEKHRLCAEARELRMLGSSRECEEKSSRLYLCTRLLGHTGPHIACGGEHNLDIWE
jgi:hypothetical protein